MPMSDSKATAHAEHFASVEQQEHAAHLGMWVFLASEALLFAGFFALYACYRAEYGAGFIEGVEHGKKIIGSINTLVLLTSSYTVACSVESLRAGRPARSVALVSATVLMGIVFLALKFWEYALHFREGIIPNGTGRFFAEHTTPGLKSFFTIYYLATGLHALHVTVGMCVLCWIGASVAKGTVTRERSYKLALGAMYWHLVDVVWIFLWPLFYLTGRGGR
jgi:cytochrome c oxidase subunit 3